MILSPADRFAPRKMRRRGPQQRGASGAPCGPLARSASAEVEGRAASPDSANPGAAALAVALARLPPGGQSRPDLPTVKSGGTRN
jgi:hypothetical protein